jgi:hypothetical protein
MIMLMIIARISNDNASDNSQGSIVIILMITARLSNDNANDNSLGVQ